MNWAGAALRVWRTEARRGIAPLALVAVAAAGSAAIFNETEDWAGRWNGLTVYLRVVLIVLIPIALATGAWAAGRERRRRIEELLASTPRPAWHRVTASYAAVAAGACAGLVVAWSAGAVLVVRVATYSGGGWWWLLLGALVAMGAASAVGYGVGRLAPWRVTAPILGLIGYVGLGILSYVDGGVSWLSPSLSGVRDGYLVEPSFQLLQITWLIAVGAVALVAAAARRWWLALIPVAVAVGAGALIAGVGPEEPWNKDPVALELVCVPGSPEVCAVREQAFLLDELVPIVQGVFKDRDVAFDATTRVLASPYEGSGRARGTAAVTLRPYITWSGGLTRTGEYGSSLLNDLLDASLPQVLVCYRDDDMPAVDTIFQAWELSLRWADGRTEQPDPLAEARFDRLMALDAADRGDWASRYVRAVDRCDVPAVRLLLDELS